VLGRTWTCDEGSGNSEVGCVASNPADLSDAWELERVRMLAKWGAAFPATMTFYVRHANVRYRVRYTPAGGTLGAPLSLRVRVERCLNTACSSLTLLGEPTVPYSVVSEYLVWDNGAFRTEPIGYFSQSGSADPSATNTCDGWDPNNDSVSDRYAGYSLRWPTITGDPRGVPFDQGDVLPFDWLADHRSEIQGRLAPNVVGNPFATPDFRSSPYLRDTPAGGEAFLRLKDENARPLIASGSTPHGTTLLDFRNWYAGWLIPAAGYDPAFGCRPVSVVLITDGDETCLATDPCTVAASLYSSYGVRTFVAFLGGDLPPGTKLECIAQNGQTGDVYTARNRAELTQALEEIFVEAGQP
jgi:hypothetical protein